MIRKQAILVISGYNIRAVIAFCRWATAHRIDFHIIARDYADPIFLTSYKNQVAFVRSSPEFNPESLHSWVKTLCDRYKYHRVLILPSTEYLNRFLLNYRSSIECEYCLVPLTEASLYNLISDKYSFAKLCESYGLNVPDEFNGVPMELPFVAKPRKYFSSAGKQLVPQLVCDMDDLERFRREKRAEDYFFQRFISGRSLYLLAYIQANREDVLYSQENLVQQARGGSIILARHSDFHLTESARRYVSMLHDIKFSGLIMVEVRLEESTDRYFMIEANPRLWGPLQFPIDNGVDVFGALLYEYGFEIDTPSLTPSGTDFYFWSGGITQEFEPMSYHNYSSNEFMKDFPILRTQDIFFRQDTFNLYLHELGMVHIRES